MENVMSNSFQELSIAEAQSVDGGGPVAAVYALGFIFGCSPLGALCIVGAAVVVGVGIAIAA